MGKIKVSNVRMRRNLAAGGALISVIPILVTVIAPSIFEDTEFTRLFYDGSLLLLVVGLPLSALLMTRFNRTLRRAKVEYEKRKT